MSSTKKNLSGLTLFLVIIGLCCSLIFPWWVIVPLFVVICATQSIPSGQAFTVGFLAGTLIWSGYAQYLDVPNMSKLSTQIGQVFQGLSSIQIKWVTATLGGTLGGFSALVGSSARKLIA
jgi:membrane-anchored glycerophosphoryl diester phosphodiesterase (GDPDase)